MKVALVHDWITGMRGGERVLEVLCELYPEAPIYTLVYNEESVGGVIEEHEIIPSFINKLPGKKGGYRRYLPLFPHAIESFDLRGYDLIVSSSHCVAKGVITPPGATHVCYIHTPMRYVWDLYPDYFGPGRAGPLTRLAAAVCAPFLRMWDVTSAARVQGYIANSAYVAGRVRNYYDREAAVVHPPVSFERFAPADQREDFYLMVSALAPYKRVDMAIEAFRGLDKRLVIAGSGQDLERLSEDTPKNVELLGWVDDDKVTELYSKARAFIFPGVEDFGITPLEAMASGCPVIALGAGGALETVVPSGVEGRAPTGVFFSEQTPEALRAAVIEFEAQSDAFSAEALREHARGFRVDRFREELRGAIDAVVKAASPGRALTEAGDA